jgi:6-phosphofructokinase 1
VIVAEGAKFNAEAMAAYFKTHQQKLGFSLRVTTLGHVQRGGNPGAFDRILATRLAGGATEALARGEFGVLVGTVRGEIKTTPYPEIVGKQKPLDPRLLELAGILAK